MSRAEKARQGLQWVNVVGLLVYLYWLSTRSERLFYHADGVLFLLPCILFIFVFLYLRHGPVHPEDRDP